MRDACQVRAPNMSTPRHIPGSAVVPVLSVRTEDGRTFRLSRSFHIGRERDCEVRIDDGRVSRKHAVVSFENGHWQLRDRQSGNGVFANGRRIQTATIDRHLTIRLSADGPSVVMEVAEPAALPTSRPPAARQGWRRDDAPGALRRTLLRHHAGRRAGRRTDLDDPQSVSQGPEETKAPLSRPRIGGCVGGRGRGQLCVLRPSTDGAAERGGAGAVLHDESARRGYRRPGGAGGELRQLRRARKTSSDTWSAAARCRRTTSSSLPGSTSTTAH